MNCRVRARKALVLAAACPLAALSLPAAAAELPQVKLSAENTVPACATPGRLMSFLEGRNSGLDPKFATIAADYMRIGEELGIRWDTAFFQMILETGNLTYKGDVSPKQNNFAGLGATGRKEPGESFPDVQTGVKAHLEHLLMYSGERIANPVATRTRNIQEWGVLTSWQNTIKTPMTFGLVAKKWAPTSRAYARDISGIADAFYDGACNRPDPKPEMLALAKPQAKATAVANAEKTQDTSKVSGAELARRAVAEARASGSFVRSNLGASSLMPTDATSKPVVGETPVTTAAAPVVKIINAEQPETTEADPATSANTASTETEVKTAALGSGARAAVPAAAAAAKITPPGCKVWTASYGGSRAIIIKARADKQENFTVLDVNEGSEKREAEAYIAAYAKGGELVGEFTSPSQALDKAFELCPEG